MSGIICPHCGQTHREQAKFCPLSGKLIVREEQPAEIHQPAPQPEGMAGLTGRLPPSSFLHNRYLILRKIGQGGMAAVYQASDTSQPGPLWAIKEMSDAALSSSDRDYAVKSFIQEGELLRRLSHPNLPKVIDVFNEGGKHYLVMEFIPGRTLQNMLDGCTQSFSESDVLLWALQLCDVLSYLHSQKPPIIFRDLKPSNIMLTPQNQIKLIDFGIVRFFKPGQSRDTLALGTPGYAAHEAIGGQTDERSDIYSLCVTLHQLLTLNDPGHNMFHIPLARQLNPLVSPEMERVLQCGMNLQREHRFASASEMRTALAQVKAASFQQPGAYPAVVAPAVERPAPAPVAAGHTDISPMGGVEKTLKGDALPAPVTPAGVQPPPARISRPTTRLVMAASQLSGRQVAFLTAGLFIAIVILTWTLTSVLSQITAIWWNFIPIMAIFGPLGYAAYPKRGSAALSHGGMSFILVAVIWLRLGDTQSYTWVGLILATLLSAAFVELWAWFLPKIKGRLGDEGWRREAAWLAGMAVFGTAIFMGVTTAGVSGFHPIQWLISAILGSIGWFIGDFTKQSLLHRKSGASLKY
jgi:serine/threonine-protein kinase